MARFTFISAAGNPLRGTSHCDHENLVVLECRHGQKWYLLRRRRFEEEQAVHLRDVPRRVKEALVFSTGEVYLNPETGNCSRFELDVRPDPFAPAPRRSPRPVTTRRHHDDDDMEAAALVGAFALGALLGSARK